MNDTRRAILESLEAQPMTGPDLANDLGITRAAVWKHVEALREGGFAIESSEDGYVLENVPEYGGDAVEYGLGAPFDVEFHESIESTNERGRQVALEGATDVVVLANEQTAGRGRLGRSWDGPSGGIYLSVVLRPSLMPAQVPLLTLAAAVATTRAAREAGVRAGIKWPNDVLVTGEFENDQPVIPSSSRSSKATGEPTERKLAGVLTEIEAEADRISWAVLGIGINANVGQTELPSGATSLSIERGSPVNRRRFVQVVLERLDGLRTTPDRTLDEWREYGLTLGRHVRIETATETIEGEAIDLTSAGALIVDTGTDHVRVHAGDCVHLRSQ